MEATAANFKSRVFDREEGGKYDRYRFDIWFRYE